MRDCYMWHWTTYMLVRNRKEEGKHSLNNENTYVVQELQFN
jgi:hypothetical protein